MTSTTTKPEPATVLEEVYADLAEAKAVITAAIDQDPDGFIRLGFAEGEAADALSALRSAPSLPSTAISRAQANAETAATATADGITAALDRIAAAATRASETLIGLAEHCPDARDVAACLDAARYAGRLREQFE
ncbi:hypothetical protein [Actinomadura harenae]|uniref:Uncharacterized protein n=1 Tax=Actinomadura harenae TaxID=2483351 RepID=A0A3M2M2U6_9ACTN|nr:hypothetical protein [Actinomadura harenae]RMI43919.1 hypothetical protein EBO15_14545 [Actinomadura harenae]